jgi:hypothetical protein
MRTAPIQLINASFRRIVVEVDSRYIEDAMSSSLDPHALFEGVVIVTEVGCKPLEQADPRGSPYFVTLRVLIDNEQMSEQPAQRASPYRIDIEAGGVVVLAPGAERLGDPEDLVRVNGPALLWSAIREVVANATSRMPLGMAFLPSVNFHDLKKAAPAAVSEAAAPSRSAIDAPKPKRAQAKKKS